MFRLKPNLALLCICTSVAFSQQVASQACTVFSHPPTHSSWGGIASQGKLLETVHCTALHGIACRLSTRASSWIKSRCVRLASAVRRVGSHHLNWYDAFGKKLYGFTFLKKRRKTKTKRRQREAEAAAEKRKKLTAKAQKRSAEDCKKNCKAQ